MSIQRYDPREYIRFTGDNPLPAHMIESDDGEWVRWKDVKDRLMPWCSKHFSLQSGITVTDTKTNHTISDVGVCCKCGVLFQEP